MLGPVRLAEEDRALGVEAQGEQAERHLVRVAPDELRVVGARQGVVVDDAVDRVVRVLHRDVVPEGAEIVADVRQPGRLDAAEDALAPARKGLGHVGGRGLAHGRRW